MNDQALADFNRRGQQVIEFIARVRGLGTVSSDLSERRTALLLLKDNLSEMRHALRHMRQQGDAVARWLSEGKTTFQCADLEVQLDAIDMDFDRRLGPLEQLIRVRADYERRAQDADKTLDQLQSHSMRDCLRCHSRF